jgi:hypothetical protein
MHLIAFSHEWPACMQMWPSRDSSEIKADMLREHRYEEANTRAWGTGTSWWTGSASTQIQPLLTAEVARLARRTHSANRGITNVTASMTRDARDRWSRA